MASTENEITNESPKCDINDLTILNNLETNLLDELKQTYEKDKTISDDLLESFYFLYKNPFMEALNQIDKHENQILQNQQKTINTLNQLNNSNDLSEDENSCLVTQLKAKNSGRFAYKVKGSSNMNYYLFDNINYCSCQSFKYQVLHNFENFYCKHIILVKLLKAMNKITVKIVDDNELVQIIKLIQ